MVKEIADRIVDQKEIGDRNRHGPRAKTLISVAPSLC
jgi:hypothetical protein